MSCTRSRRPKASPRSCTRPFPRALRSWNSAAVQAALRIVSWNSATLLLVWTNPQKCLPTFEERRLFLPISRRSIPLACGKAALRLPSKQTVATSRSDKLHIHRPWHRPSRRGACSFRHIPDSRFATPLGPRTRLGEHRAWLRDAGHATAAYISSNRLTGVPVIYVPATRNSPVVASIITP